MLYEIFTGSLPFEGDSPLEVVLKHANNAPPPPGTKNPRIDGTVAGIVMKCLEKEASARFQTARELCEALSRVAEGRRRAPIGREAVA